MRIRVFVGHDQAFFFLIPLFFVFSACSRPSEELPVIPPTTNPLVRDYIGFAVVNASFVHLLSEPGPAGFSLGYLRRGTTVRIIESRRVMNREKAELWILVEGNYQRPGHTSQGWLEETIVEIYDSESRAITASKAMSK